MPSRPVTYALLLLAAGLGAVLVFIVSGQMDEGEGPGVARIDTTVVASGGGALLETNVPAPSFEMSTLHGERFAMAEHVGTVVVLNFWATWCAPCRVEIPELVEMQSDLGANSVRFVGISVDHESDEVIRAFVEEAGINYPIIVDDGSVSASFGGVYALPTTFVVDKAGVIRYRKAGLVTRDTLMPVLDALTG